MGPGVLQMTPKQSGWFGKTSRRLNELKFQRSRVKAKLIILFDSQSVLHKEFVPEGKTVNTEFFKGIVDRHLKRIQRVRPVAFWSRDIFLLHDNAPANKAENVC